MNIEQIDLVQNSFAKVVPTGATARMFYQRLFEIAPEVKPLFKRDMGEQSPMLIAALIFMVKGLKNLGTIVPVMEQLAVRHVDFGVKAEHYKAFGEALLWTLEKDLGADFTPLVKAAWTEAYKTVSGVMIAAAYPQKTA
jgi:hemoglobin-like flavoprotein